MFKQAHTHCGGGGEERGRNEKEDLAAAERGEIKKARPEEDGDGDDAGVATTVANKGEDGGSRKDPKLDGPTSISG